MRRKNNWPPNWAKGSKLVEDGEVEAAELIYNTTLVSCAGLVNFLNRTPMGLQVYLEGSWIG
jgi:hypothetical protein